MASQPQELLELHALSPTVPAAQFLENQRLLRQALIRTLDPQGAFAQSFAQQLHEHCPWLDAKLATLCAMDVARKRQGEQIKFLKELDTNAPALLQALQNNPNTPIEPYRISPEKFKELVDLLVQPRDKPEGYTVGDAMIHILASVDVQQKLHAELADIYRQGGPLHQTLFEALHKQLPPQLAADADNMAGYYMMQRQVRAQSVAGAYSPGHPVYAETLRLAEHLRAQDAQRIPQGGQQAAPVVATLDTQAQNPHTAGMYHGKEKKEKPHHKKRLTESIAYAIQTTLTCYFTDWIDPIVNKIWQDRYAARTGTQTGTWSQNVVGEFAGDAVAGASIVFAEQLFTPQMQWLSHHMAKPLRPVYNLLAPLMVDKDKNDPDYQKAVKGWIYDQEEALGNTMLFSVVGTGANIVLQKSALGSPVPAMEIFKGKVVGVLTSAALILGARAFLPTQTKQFDNFIEDKAVKPIMKPIRGGLGLPPEEEEQKAESQNTDRPITSVDKRSITSQPVQAVTLGDKYP